MLNPHVNPLMCSEYEIRKINKREEEEENCEHHDQFSVVSDIPIITMMSRWKNFITVQERERERDIHSRDENRVNFNNGYWPRHILFFFSPTHSLSIFYHNISHHVNLNESIVAFPSPSIPSEFLICFCRIQGKHIDMNTTNRWSISNELFNCEWGWRNSSWPGRTRETHIESICCRITSIYEEIFCFSSFHSNFASTLWGFAEIEKIFLTSAPDIERLVP